jgi:hypothetical protein
MNLLPFVDYLKDNLGTPEPVFLYNMPETANSGILLLHSLLGATFGDDLPGYKKASFQAIVRHATYPEGYQLAKRTMQVLDVYRQEMGGLYVTRCKPRHDPVAFPKSRGDMIEFSVNFDVVFVET